MEAIFGFTYLKSEDLGSLFRTFFGQVHAQSQIVTDRRLIFQIFELLLKLVNPILHGLSSMQLYMAHGYHNHPLRLMC